jgi:hypothetical protein
VAEDPTEVDIALIAWYFPPILLTNPEVQSAYLGGHEK